MRDVKLFETIISARDAFRDGAEKALAKRDADIKNAPSLYAKGRIAHMNAEYNHQYKQTLRKLATEFTNKVEPLISSAEDEAKARVKKINAPMLTELKAVEGLPISPAEFRELAPRYMNDYWGAVALKQIAKKNDIVAEDVPTFKVEPSLTDELAILDEISHECDEFTRLYDGSRDIKHMGLLSDKRVNTWQDRATNGIVSESRMPDDMAVRRAYSRIAGCYGELERGQQISKELDSIKPNLRIALISKIAESNILTETAIRFSKNADEILEVRNTGKSKQYEDAKAALQKVSEALEQNEYSGVIKLDDARADAKRDGNVYFETVVSSAAKNDSKLAEAASLVDGVRGSNLSGTKAD